MSLETWKKEFYPKPPSRRMTKRQAVEHSIRKWEGLTTANLKKHGLYKDHKDIQEENPVKYLRIATDSCALCLKYYRIKEKDQCENCPLRDVLGKPCDDNLYSPYQVWVTSNDPNPMIKALQRALESLDE